MCLNYLLLIIELLVEINSHKKDTLDLDSAGVKSNTQYCIYELCKTYFSKKFDILKEDSHSIIIGKNLACKRSHSIYHY